MTTTGAKSLGTEKPLRINDPDVHNDRNWKGQLAPTGAVLNAILSEPGQGEISTAIPLLVGDAVRQTLTFADGHAGLDARDAYELEVLMRGLTALARELSIPSPANPENPLCDVGPLEDLIARLGMALAVTERQALEFLEREQQLIAGPRLHLWEDS